MRHGTTDSSQPDRINLDLNDCSTQRPLNDEGRKVARMVGSAIKRLRIPVGEVRTSPMCRTRETAQLAFGDKAVVDPLLLYTSHLTTAQKQPIVENTRKYLSEPVPTGVNRVLVAHGPNLADVMGYFVKPEGTVVVLQPRGDGKFDYLASITPDQWAGLH
jgi:phosphohistidine phosphatase SixA